MYFIFKTSEHRYIEVHIADFSNTMNLIQLALWLGWIISHLPS